MLTREQLDYTISNNTLNSQKVVGTYDPKTVTKEEVEQEVKGSFGGRFLKFEDGIFEYIAYTD